MHNPIQHRAIPLPLLAVSEYASAERRPVQWRAFTPVFVICRGGKGKKEVGGGGGEVGEDLSVAWCSGLDDAAGEDVGVDYGEGVRWRGEDGGYG